MTDQAEPGDDPRAEGTEDSRESHAASWRTWRPRRPATGTLLLAAVAYIPLLLTRPGMVGADTKTYLYLDPGRLLARAPFMWDTNIGLGTVTHQNIGYLWPMGPYYFVFETLGIPDWIAQRVWLGSIIFLAGLGVRWMMRELRWDGGGATVAAFAYALSPYLLDYAARISVILLPFVGLPWLIGLAARCLRRDDWRSPAWFALVTLTVGGVNATSLVLVMVGPILWFVHATFVAKEVTLRTAVRAGLRITLLTAVTSLWWLAGLALQGSHGIPILRYTETYETVATAALAPELLRGLGYWFFYGRDSLGAWTESTVGLVEVLPLLALSFVIPGLALAAGALTRWRNRIYFAAIVTAGLVIGVGSHPWDSPTPFGELFKAWSRTDLGLSFRSTPRAVPLIALGLAVFLGAGVAALGRWRPRWHVPVAGALIVLICLNQIALFRGQMVDRNLMRDEEVPEYWLEAAAAMDEGDPWTRVLEMPGIDFAAYRWGNTVDPITPGLMDRDFVARELIPYGSPASANLLNEFDQPFQAGRVDPAAITPMAQMMGVGEIALRGDLQYERYLSPRPRHTYQQLLNAPGLGDPLGFGEPVPNIASDELPLDDELEMGTPVTHPDPSPVTLFPLEDPRSLLRTVDASAPVVMAGDATGMVNLAALGALQVDRPLFYAASFADDPAGLRAVVDEPDTELVVTDTNRRQARRWGSVRENDGHTEFAGEEPVERDHRDNRLEVFADETDDDRTVLETTGTATVSASAYGNAVTYTPGDRPSNAMDGTENTSWRVAAFEKAEGNYLQVDLAEPVSADQMALRQIPGDRNRWITEISVEFDDDGEPLVFTLDETSRQEGGQSLSFPERSFSRVRITIDATDRGILQDYRGVSGVGISELVIPGVEPSPEVVRPPVRLLDELGESSLGRALRYVFARRAPNPGDVVVADEEPTMRRRVTGPVARSFTPYGKARMVATTPDARIDELLGIPGADAGGVTASSNARLEGSLLTRASKALDGDTTTAYQSRMNTTDAQLSVTYAEPVTVNGLDLQVYADGKHSIPTVITVAVDGGEPLRVELPRTDLGDGAERGTIATLRADTGELVGSRFDIAVVEADEAETKDWFGGGRVVLPVAIAELGLPTIDMPAPETPVDDRCRDDLVTIDGAGVPVRVVGTVRDAEALAALRLESCGAPVELPAGTSLLETAEGITAGVDVELLALASAPGGAPGVDTLTDPPDAGPTPPPAEPSRPGRLHYELTVRDATQPYWVVLGQSFSDGWTAETSEGVELGEPTLINGFANGWLIDPAEHGADVTVVMRWTPQGLVWIGLAGSALGVLACLFLIVRGRGGPSRAGATVVGQVLRPTWRMPWEPAGPPLTLARSLLLVSWVFLAASVFGGLYVGAATALVTFVGAALPRGQWISRCVPLAVLAACFGYIVVKQARNNYEVAFGWVEYFEASHLPAMAGIFMLMTSVIVDRMRASGPADAGPTQPEPARA